VGCLGGGGADGFGFRVDVEGDEIEGFEVGHCGGGLVWFGLGGRIGMW
jgi:hypothetical protein